MADQHPAQADEADILDGRVRLLYKQAPIGLMATLINGTIVVIVLWDVVVPARLLLIWWAALCAITVARGGLVFAYHRDFTAAERARSWLRRFTVGAFGIGACWGFAGTLLYPAESPAHEMFLLTVLAGMSAGAVPLLGSVWFVYAGYAALMLLPTIGWLLLQDETIHSYIALMVLLYLGTVLASAGRISANIMESLRLRYERSELIERLSRSKLELERANSQLAEEAQRRMHAQRKLQDNHYFLTRVMDSASDGIFVIDQRGRFTRVNHAMARFAAVDPQKLTGTPFIDLFTPKWRQTLEPVLDETLHQREGRTLRDLELLIGTEQTRFLSVSIAPLVEQDQVSALVGVARDVTGLRQLERMKEDFVSTVSHELRTPLTSIRGALGLIKRTSMPSMDEQTRSLLEIADSNSERLLRLIEDLLDLQSLGNARMRFRFSVESLGQIVEQSVETNRAYAQQYNVRLRLFRPLSAEYVRVDRDRFIQVLTNLISNAVKFSPPGAQVRVFTETLDYGVRVSVEDHGPGVPPEFRDRIFERFAQADSSNSRNKGGTGLGLSISKSLIEGMNGRIGFTSDVGRGSIFFIELPITEAPGTTSDASPTDA